jgi:predicted HNH restriction endonuclease/predicted RNA-binding protein with PUA-like domain
MHEWWAQWPDQKFWLEATDREDIGSDLRAPEFDESGKENWRYTLFKATKSGDIVLHYDSRTQPNGIVGWSTIAGTPRPERIIWGARGSYAREKAVKPHERAGYIVPLAGFQRLPNQITLAGIRALETTLGAVLEDLKRKYGEPLYFPFEVSAKRPLRPLQGYAFKLPREFLTLFPELSALLEKSEHTGSGTAGPVRNPPWTRDELILALDLYFSNPASPPAKQSAEVLALSRLLNKMGHALGMDALGDFRNPNGVYMKMMNFRRFDPAYTGQGRVGLTRGNKDEGVVWNEFAGDRPRLARVAAAIRTAIEQDAAELAQLPSDDEGMEAPEGRVLTRLHRVRERNRKLVEQRKARAFREYGALTCEACDFNFEKRYGERGQGFIEAHHTKALATLSENTTTKLEDLALVCSNCHRMIHAQKPWLSIDQLRTILR